MSKISDLETPFAIGFNHGFFLRLSDDGNSITEVHERAPIGIGLTLVVPIAQRSNIFRRNHRLLHQYYDCFTDASSPMFIRSVHSDNDSGAVSTGAGKGMSNQDIETILQEGFSTDLASLMAL